MKVLVTGGAGFIGSNLCEHLLNEGHTVRCLDNFATGKPKNIFPLLEKFSGTFELQVGDIRNLDDCRKAVDGMEYVLHEAALGSVPRSIKDPITTNDVNIGGFMNMIVASRCRYQAFCICSKFLDLRRQQVAAEGRGRDR